ncbi:transcriptional regulator [Pseudoflavonifractor sp. 524-17]|uniref:transcriptional regulator n=1 Tax=Pseudoflavonifractor sp. 524-17 TaxID=2304577 RepID=UPI00137A339A|nr:transcriptional regulator [Pseudoflavonifractor sp. 524-17]
MTRAYSKLYLDSAQDVLGHAFDWVSNTCNEDIASFCALFAKSRVALMFESGYPKYVAGCNGAELVNFVLEDLCLPEYEYPHEFYAQKSPEYWAGWVLAYFQWKSSISFMRILKKISVERILALYPVGHEQDVRNVADIFEEWMNST